jgi:hypothetical protein
MPQFIMPNIIISVMAVLLFNFATAELLITYPAGGETLSGLSDYTITWIESNIVPLISDLDSYTMFLYAGTNDNYVCLHSGSPQTVV